jgi:hypothetical protein
MGEHAITIIAGAKRVAQYGQVLLKDLDHAKAGAKPRGQGGVVIDTNTPTFVYGHLALYPVRILTLLGASEAHAAAVRAPEGWEPLFKAGAPCEDDFAGTKYPTFAAVSEHFFRAHAAAIAAIETAHDSQFTAMFPDPARREVFPTVGAAINFLMTAHPMVHFGQVSAWRRCMGLASAMS